MGNDVVRATAGGRSARSCEAAKEYTRRRALAEFFDGQRLPGQRIL
jgi:hypothetical protein